MFGILVARRLLTEETVEYRGQKLLLTHCVGLSEAFKNSSGFSLASSQPVGSRCSSFLIKQGDQLQYPNAVSSSTSAESSDDILKYWWRSDDYGEQTVQTVMEAGENVEDDVYEKLEVSTVESPYEQLRHCIELPVTEEYQCQKLQFPDEELQLIHKLILSSCLEELGAEICVKLDKCVVKISGTANDVGDAERMLRELVDGFVTAGVDISKTSAKLLSMKVGEDWLDARLAKEQLVAVFCVKDAVSVVMTDCQDRLSKVKCIVESSLVTRRIQLERHQTGLLRSAVWQECIDNLQSTHLLRIFEADMMLFVEGCVDGAEDAVDRLSRMLGENSRINHTVKLGRGTYRVVCFRSREIQQDAKYVGCCVCF